VVNRASFHLTFTRCQTGPLDRRVEKDESHPGKVVERRWFERNKHIFRASRWEIYDPLKTTASIPLEVESSMAKKRIQRHSQFEREDVINSIEIITHLKWCKRICVFFQVVASHA